MPPRKRQQRQQTPEGYARNSEADVNPVPQLVNLLVGTLANTLNAWLCSQISMFQPNSFTTGLDRPFVEERERNALPYNHEQREKKGEGGNNTSSSRTSNTQKRKWTDNVTAGNQQAKKVEACNNCGKKHVGVCLKGKRVCFNCGLKGHIAPNCPSPRKGACFTCGSKEHLARDCPKKAAGKASGGKGSNNSGNLVIVELAPPSQPTEHTFEMTVKGAMQGTILINDLNVACYVIRVLHVKLCLTNLLEILFTSRGVRPFP